MATSLNRTPKEWALLASIYAAGGGVTAVAVMKLGTGSVSESITSLIIPILVGAGLVAGFGLLLQLFYDRFFMSHKIEERVQERTRELVLNEEHMRDMAETSSDWFWKMDTRFRLTEISERFKSETGVSPDKYIGKTRIEALGLDEKNLEQPWLNYLKCLERRDPFVDIRYRTERENGEEAWLSISGKPVYDENGNFCCYHGSGRDVTDEEKAKQQLFEKDRETKRYIEELEVSRRYLERNTQEISQLAEEYAVAKERAEASERSKSEFLASMSHEIRTPMTGVMGFADLLLDGNLNHDDRDKVIKIKSATQSLLTIIDDILDLSKLEAGRLEIESLDFNVQQAIDEAIDLVDERARSKGLKLDVNHGPGVPIGLNSDPTRFRQILINLVGNAVKFTQQGEVSVATEFISDEHGDALKVSVRDTGIGVSEENQHRLFQDFSQADASTSRSYAGTGLGLAISKRLVELMGGQIGVKSQAGEGSVFWFSLPFRPATEDVTFVERRSITRDYGATRQLSILVAEDNILNQRIIEATLSRYGHATEIVANGALAVEAVQSVPYDLVLMDVRMPEMNGTDATMAVRNLADERTRHIPIIALTADAMEEHVRGYFAAGMNACVTKPIDRAELLLTINKVLNEEVHVPKTEERDSEPKSEFRSSKKNNENDQLAESVASFLNDVDKVSSEIEKEKLTN